MKISPILRGISILGALATMAACAQRGASEPSNADSTSASPQASILKASTPANGAALSSSPANLVLVFARPVRLAEVMVEGSDGSQMPMMVSAAGENERYALPLHELAAGSYTVSWRALSGGEEHRGAIHFTIG